MITDPDDRYQVSGGYKLGLTIDCPSCTAKAGEGCDSPHPDAMHRNRIGDATRRAIERGEPWRDR